MTNDSTFTAGPWEAIQWDGVLTGEIAIDGGINRHSIAMVSQARDEWRANARLIAAAPEMADVLRRAAEQLAHCLGNDNPIVVEARELLGKAGAE